MDSLIDSFSKCIHLLIPWKAPLEGSRRLTEGPRRVQEATRRHQDAPEGFLEVGEASQEAPGGPRTPSQEALSAQRLQEPPRRPWKHPRRPQETPRGLQAGLGGLGASRFLGMSLAKRRFLPRLAKNLMKFKEKQIKKNS